MGIRVTLSKPNTVLHRTAAPHHLARTLAGNNIMTKTYRHSAGFGKRIEYWIIGRMLKEGLDIYVPLVDDDAIDAVTLTRERGREDE